jgi:hypothetical protein
MGHLGGGNERDVCKRVFRELLSLTRHTDQGTQQDLSTNMARVHHALLVSLPFIGVRHKI